MKIVTPTEGVGFSGGGGVNLPNFPVERGVTIGKYFQRVLVTRKRVTKKKYKNQPRQFICEDIKHIADIFCQSLGVTSHAKTFFTVCRFRADSVSV